MISLGRTGFYLYFLLAHIFYKKLSYIYNHRCDSSGKVTKISYSNHMRDSAMGIPLSKVKTFYQALIYFEKMLMDPKYCIRYLMQDGKLFLRYFSISKYSSTLSLSRKSRHFTRLFTLRDAYGSKVLYPVPDARR